MQSPMIKRIKKEAKKVEAQKFFIIYLKVVAAVYIILGILTFIK